jgi:SH3-like domain-containing protein
MSVRRGIASIASVTPLLVFVCHLQYATPAAAKETWRITDIAASARIHMREEANNRSRIIAYIPGDARGLSRGECERGWCEVEYQGLTGWVFARYLARDTAPPREKTTAGPAAPLNAFAAKKILRLAQRDGAPLPIYTSPDGDRAAGNIPAGVETVEGLGSCVRDRCQVRAGVLVGWLKADAFAAEDEANDQGATAALAVTVATDPGKALNKTEPTATQAAVPVAALQPLGDLDTKSYTLAGLGGQSSLAMREQPDGTSRILGWIPNGATDVQGLRKCVEKWCLVRHGAVSGWVARRHLADVAVESSQMFQAKGVALWGAVDVLDYPNANANVVGKIPSYATGIVPIGGCDDEWCHVRYLGIAGWVNGQNLEPQAR